MVQVVVLTPNGESRTLKTGAITGVPTGEMVAKAMRKTRAAELIGTYKMKDGVLQLWGWKSGKAGTENKHELPPPHDKILLFSEIVVTNSAGKDFIVEEWKEFYNRAFKGFAEIGPDDSDDEGEEAGSEEEVSIDGDAEEDDEYEEELEDEGSDVGVEDEDGEVEESEEEVEDDEEFGEEEEEEELEDDGADDDCYDEGDDNGGGGRRRTPRRRTTQGPEYRRMELGVRSRIKMPVAVGKRAPRWQTAPELIAESYDE